MSQDATAAKPIMNYKLRRSQDGQWLWLVTVTKGGSPLRITNLQGVEANASQYEFNPQFISVEDSAWVGSLSMAESYQRILSRRCDILTDIVERT